MTLLNRPSDGLISVLIALRNALLALGPQSESQLLALAAPPTVTSDGKPDMARKTLVRWIQLGFFIREGQTICLAPEIQSVARDDIDQLRAAVLRLLLKPDNNPAFESDGTDEEQSRSSDWTRAAAWILAQDPYELSTAWEDIQRLQNLKDPFVNNVRWSGFLDWARFTGIGYSMHGNTLVLNPAFALRTALETIFANHRELSQAEFLRHAREALPILDGGTYRLSVERQIAGGWTPMLAHQLSPSLSVALLTLEATRHIRLDQRSDAAQCTLIGRQGNPLRQVSHFVRGQVP